ncbi:MAG: hypothetical protein ACREJ6_09760 [Candidatus Methylomirabilis sp.]
MRTRRRVERDKPGRATRIDVGFDRRAAEALALELSMLAKAYGLGVERIEITAPERRARARR